MPCLKNGILTVSFDPSSVHAFRFVGYEYDEAEATARFRYALDPGPEFVEVISFPGGRTGLRPDERDALDRCLRLLFVACGVSYFKTAAPPRLAMDAFDLTPGEADFFGSLYRLGLGEMAYENRLDLSDLRFDADPSETPKPVSVDLGRRTAVAIGGGKDSIVALELLAACSEPMLLISVGSHGPVREVVEVAQRRHPDLRYVQIQRRISPTLLELNDQGALNGHIPISAIFALLLSTAGILYDFDTVAVGNERSANVGSLIDGVEVNHQWSKSYLAERMIAELIRTHAVPGLLYFSALRPLSELAIARAFAGMSDYHSVFLSCNAAFRLRGAERTWCGNCPKCRFVFLALAPFLEKTKLLEIFNGSDLLADSAQSDGFRALAGLGAPKPFECVGEVLESQAAMEKLSHAPEWSDSPVLASLERDLSKSLQSRRDEIDTWSRPSDEHAVPKRFLEAILAAR